MQPEGRGNELYGQEKAQESTKHLLYTKLLRRSKSDLWNVFKKSVTKRSQENLQVVSKDNGHFEEDVNKASELRHQPYRAYRSGTGPLILVKQPLNQQGGRDSQRGRLFGDEDLDGNQPNLGAPPPFSNGNKLIKNLSLPEDNCLNQSKGAVEEYREKFWKCNQKDRSKTKVPFPGKLSLFNKERNQLNPSGSLESPEVSKEAQITQIRDEKLELRNADSRKEQQPIGESRENTVLVRQLQEISKIKSRNHINKSSPILLRHTSGKCSGDPPENKQSLTNRTTYRCIRSALDFAKTRQSESQKDDAVHYVSFSNYLIRSRKNSLAEKGRGPSSKVEEPSSKVEGPSSKVEEVKSEILKRVHFPDDRYPISASGNNSARTLHPSILKRPDDPTYLARKPPRGQKRSKRTTSEERDNTIRQIMSTDKDSILRQNSPGQNKENAKPTFRISEPQQSHQKRKHEQHDPSSSSEWTLSSESTSPPNPAPPPTFKGDKNKHSPIDEEASENRSNVSASILSTACQVSEENQVLRLLRDLAKTTTFDPTCINERDQSGRTALSHSCSNGCIGVVEFLTSQPHIDLNLADSEGNTPLHYAAQGGCTISLPSGNPELPDDESAFATGHVDIVSHLVNTRNRQVDLDARNHLGFTPLMKAALQGRTKIAKILLFAGASPHLRDYGRGLNAMEWARFTARGACSDLIESVQRSCASHIRDRWSTSDPDIKIPQSPTERYFDSRDSWLKHKIKKAFTKSESKKEFRVAPNLPALASCMSSPLLPNHHQLATQDPLLPKVQVTEVFASDSYLEPPEPEPPSNSQDEH